MTHLVDFVRTPDDLLRSPQLASLLERRILGMDVRFESNSARVIELARESFGTWPVSSVPVDEGLCVRIIVHDDVERAEAPSPVRHISTDDGRLYAHSPGSVAVVEPLRRESVAYVTTALVRDGDHFRETVLEAITFALLACFDRHPLHAAGIAHEGHAVLLAAQSGIGKSTLAYLAHRAGIEVLGDDRVWVQLDPALRIWSAPSRIRLLPDSGRHFEELATVGSAPDAGPKHAVAFEANGERASRPCDSATMCVLQRGDHVALERIGGSELCHDLARQLAPGFDRFAARHERVMSTLTANGGWRLTLSDDPFDALPHLRRMLDAR